MPIPPRGGRCIGIVRLKPPRPDPPIRGACLPWSCWTCDHKGKGYNPCVHPEADTRDFWVLPASECHSKSEA